MVQHAPPRESGSPARYGARPAALATRHWQRAADTDAAWGTAAAEDPGGGRRAFWDMTPGNYDAYIVHGGFFSTIHDHSWMRLHKPLIGTDDT